MDLSSYLRDNIYYKISIVLITFFFPPLLFFSDYLLFNRTRSY